MTIKKTNTLWKYCNAMVNLYGSISAKKAFDIIQKQTNNKYTFEEFIDFLKEYENSKEYERPETSIFCVKALMNEPELTYIENVVFELLLDDPALVKKFLRQQSLYDFYVPAKDELLKYAHLHYFGDTTEIEALKDFILANLRVKEDAKNIVSILTWPLVTLRVLADPNEVVKKLAPRLKWPKDFDERVKKAEELSNLTTAVFRTTRLWALRGHTVEEVNPDLSQFESEASYDLAA